LNIKLIGSIILGCDIKFSLEDVNLEYVKKDESAIYSKALHYQHPDVKELKKYKQKAERLFKI
jgi:hypothetical protein